MSDNADNMPSKPAEDFQRQAELPQLGLVAEFVDFLRYNKKWWLTPIIVILLAITVLMVLSSSAMAPLIYPLF